ncbi:MAG: MarR family transcriptional regulator [Xanthomonadales bacterium]|nr:MarR family transcriptional regulator [Xanthomonadales bacterium]
MSDSKRMKSETSSWLAVVRAYQECNRRYSQMLAGFDLTVPQFDVMNSISALGDSATPKAIAERLIVTRGNITGVLHRLQDHSLVVTEQHDSDGRSFVCKLTKRGAARLAQARQAATIFIGKQLAPFNDARLVDTERTMTRMFEHLQTIEPEEIIETVLPRSK